MSSVHSRSAAEAWLGWYLYYVMTLYCSYTYRCFFGLNPAAVDILTHNFQ